MEKKPSRTRYFDRVLLSWCTCGFVFYLPNYLGHADNYVPANPSATPAHIVPEWYFLPFYAILRAVPDALLGVILMFAAIAVLAFLPWLDTSEGPLGAPYSADLQRGAVLACRHCWCSAGFRLASGGGDLRSSHARSHSSSHSRLLPDRAACCSACSRSRCAAEAPVTEARARQESMRADRACPSGAAAEPSVEGLRRGGVTAEIRNTRFENHGRRPSSSPGALAASLAASPRGAHA